MAREILNDSCYILDSYKGRDKVLRTLSYIAKFAAESHKDTVLKNKLSKFGNVMSTTRATLRLFDDVAALRATLEYGLGGSEPDKFMAALGVIANLLDHAYLPIEKVVWLAKHEMISVKDEHKWAVASSACWVASTFLGIVKTLRYLMMVSNKRKSISELSPTEIYQLLALLRLCMDFVHSVNALPQGFLWSSRIKPRHISIMGTVSSILGIYLILYKRKT